MTKRDQGTVPGELRHGARRTGVAFSLDYRLIDDNSECNFLDKAVVGGR